jgi:hypothetical protein
VFPRHKADTASCEKLTCAAQGFGMLTLDFLGEDLGCSFCESYHTAVKEGVCKKGRAAGFMDCGIQKQDKAPEPTMWQKLAIAAAKITRKITFIIMVIAIKFNAKTLLEKFVKVKLVRFEVVSGSAILWHNTPAGEHHASGGDYAIKCSCEAKLDEQKRFYKSVKSTLENLERLYGN